LFGNGGSATDASHLAAELVNSYETPLPAISLASDQAVITSIANDRGFEHIFEHQLRAIGNQLDVAIGISTSGNSENVIRGVITARELGMTTIGFCGWPGGELSENVDRAFISDEKEVSRVQEWYMNIGHRLFDKVGRMFHDSRE